ncbi:MAG: argininosuccinate lyase [Nitrospiraceae bacterium]|nr:argininosuccinate lyase [Nitrospiraceae bacterium]
MPAKRKEKERKKPGKKGGGAAGKKLWGGRFTERTSGVVEAFTESISFDWRLWKYDIEGSIAHAKMLGRQGIISKKDASLIAKGLCEIADDIEAGRFSFRRELEDIHMNIESALTERIGPAGGKLHTARSRNDQIALDLRLYLRAEAANITGLLKRFKDALVQAAEKNADTVMPGYTHLQRAQPVLLSHHLLAYAEMADRDLARLSGAMKRINVLPLGSCALAGTSLRIDRHFVADLLHFESVSDNSMDSVSDRDFVIEFIAASALVMMHLSRFSEEIVLWASQEFSFIELPDAFATGSSIMPQKKNPDVAELVRGKTGRVYGNLMNMLTIMKGLPLSYNRDLQEDKMPLFDTVDTVKAALGVLSEMLPAIGFKKERLQGTAEEGFSTATDLAEYLVRKGMPFREAHGVSGRVVLYAIKNCKMLTALGLDELKGFSRLFEADVFDVLAAPASVNAKQSYGGTAYSQVSRQIRKHRKAPGR